MSDKIISARVVSKPQNTRKPWVVRYWGDTGKQREKSYRTQREAIDARDRMLAESRSPETTVTFASAYEQWLAQHAVKASTKTTYRTIYSHNMSKPLGGRKLADVCRDPGAVQKVAQCSGGASVLAIACSVAAWSQREGMITDNRLVRSQLRHGTVKRVRQHVEYTPEQLATITAYLGRDGILAQVMHGTGCRISEALALRGDDFAGSPGKYRVQIVRQRERSTGADTDLKISGKHRSVPVSDALYKSVRAHALRYGTGGGRLSASTYSGFADKIRKACAAAKVRMTPHNFRHDRALRWERAGMRVTDIAYYLGDSVMTVTTVYLNHASLDAEAIARAAM
jgi:integrase